MNRYIDYIEKSCAKLGSGQKVYLYKKSLLDKMTERCAEVTHAGLKDENVAFDLITGELGNLESGYGAFLKLLKKKRRAELMKVGFPIGGLIALILIFISYFTVSDLTGAWDKSWLIIVGGIFAMIIFYLFFAVRKLCTMPRAFHPIARVIIGGCVMLFMVFVFLFLLMMLPDYISTWPVLPAGVGLMLLVDLAFAYATKQKFRTISFFVYMPVVATMIYIVLAAYGVVSWSGGWPLIFTGILVDLIYILVVLLYNMRYFTYRQEVEE